MIPAVPKQISSPAAAVPAKGVAPDSIETCRDEYHIGLERLDRRSDLDRRDACYETRARSPRLDEIKNSTTVPEIRRKNTVLLQEFIHFTNTLRISRHFQGCW